MSYQFIYTLVTVMCLGLWGGGYSYKYCTRAMGYINNELTDETETTIHI